jgi:hypothetical protein
MYLVASDFAFGIIFEMAITLEAALHELAEL